MVYLYNLLQVHIIFKELHFMVKVFLQPMLLKIFSCKSLSTLFTNKFLFPSGKYHVFVYLHLGSIGRSTLNSPIG